MKNKLFRLQTLTLAGGSIFAWYTVFGDFSRFFSAGGRITQFSGCQFPNPLITPCFYGAIAFLIALGWSIFILQNPENKKRISQKRLNWLLLAGTLFAWSMVAKEFYKYFTPHTGAYIGCSGLPTQNPVFTPCLTGASIYLISLILSIFILRKKRNR